MSNIELIKKYLPETLREIAQKFEIKDEYIIELYYLIELILTSKTIETDEQKQEWINLLQIMNVAQIEKLKLILEKEKTKLQQIEIKYDEKRTEIKKKYLIKWQQMWYIKKVNDIQSQEKLDKSKEEWEAEDLLEFI